MQSLFPVLWNAKSDKELQSFQKKFDNLDPRFVKFCVSKRKAEKKIINWVNWMFNTVREYLDSNFLDEMKRKWKFISRLWELYIISFLKKQWYNLLSTKEKYFSPDIKVEFNWKVIRIECVASSKWVGKNKLEEISEWISWGDIDMIDTPRKLRLTTVILDKQKKYQKYLASNRIGAQDPFIIAINWGESYWDKINNGIESILYGLWKTYYMKNHDSDKLEWPFLERKSTLEKSEQKIAVPNNLFERTEFEGISGIIFFGCCLISSDDYNLDGINNNAFLSNSAHRLTLIRNIFAKNKIPDWFLQDFEKNIKLKAQ